MPSGLVHGSGVGRDGRGRRCGEPSGRPAAARRSSSGRSCQLLPRSGCRKARASTPIAQESSTVDRRRTGLARPGSRGGRRPRAAPRPGRRPTRRTPRRCRPGRPPAGRRRPPARPRRPAVGARDLDGDAAGGEQVGRRRWPGRCASATVPMRGQEDRACRRVGRAAPRTPRRSGAPRPAGRTGRARSGSSSPRFGNSLSPVSGRCAGRDLGARAGPRPRRCGRAATRRQRGEHAAGLLDPAELGPGRRGQVVGELLDGVGAAGRVGHRRRRATRRCSSELVLRAIRRPKASGAPSGRVERQHGDRVRTADAGGEGRDGGAEHVDPGVVLAHHRPAGHDVLALRGRRRTRRSARATRAQQPAGRAQLGDGRELLVGGGVAELDQAQRPRPTLTPASVSSAEVRRPDGQRVAELLRRRTRPVVDGRARRRRRPAPRPSRPAAPASARSAPGSSPPRPRTRAPTGSAPRLVPPPGCSSLVPAARRAATGPRSPGPPARRARPGRGRRSTPSSSGARSRAGRRVPAAATARWRRSRGRPARRGWRRRRPAGHRRADVPARPPRGGRPAVVSPVDQRRRAERRDRDAVERGPGQLLPDQRVGVLVAQPPGLAQHRRRCVAPSRRRSAGRRRSRDAGAPTSVRGKGRSWSQDRRPDAGAATPCDVFGPRAHRADVTPTTQAAGHRVRVR